MQTKWRSRTITKPRQRVAVPPVARRLPVNERRELAARIKEEPSEAPANEAKRQAALAIVEETFGSIKGLDRDTLIQLAEDEEFCGYGLQNSSLV